MTPGFVNYWEHEITKPEGPQYLFAQKMVELPKVVFSRTLNSLDGRNVRVENGDLKAAVNQLKRGLGRDIVVYGGATLDASKVGRSRNTGEREPGARPPAPCVVSFVEQEERESQAAEEGEQNMQRLNFSITINPV